MANNDNNNIPMNFEMLTEYGTGVYPPEGWSRFKKDDKSRVQTLVADKGVVIRWDDGRIERALKVHHSSDDLFVAFGHDEQYPAQHARRRLAVKDVHKNGKSGDRVVTHCFANLIGPKFIRYDAPADSAVPWRVTGFGVDEGNELTVKVKIDSNVGGLECVYPAVEFFLAFKPRTSPAAAAQASGDLAQRELNAR